VSKVSIIIPVHKTTLFLKACIESALNQTHQFIEVIIVCNGGLTVQQCEDFINIKNKKLIFALSEEGRSKARTKGMQIATGQYLQFLDFDDVLYLDKISMQLRAIEASNQSQAVSITQWDIIENTLDHKILFNNDFLFVKPVLSGLELYHLLGKHKGYVMTAAWLIPKSNISKDLVWVDAPNDDAIFISEIIKPNSNLILVPKRLAAYRAHDSNTRHIRSREEFDKLILAWKTIESNLKGFQDSGVYKYFFNAYIYLIKYSINIKGYKLFYLYFKFLYYGVKARVPIIELTYSNFLLLKKGVLRVWRKIA
jgi:glycosyltransferase involved in cell wall biosynthesis